jgi:hypothetical protein
MSETCRHGVPYPCGICHEWLTEELRRREIAESAQVSPGNQFP